jgi:PAS domain S-box-containing protein
MGGTTPAARYDVLDTAPEPQFDDIAALAAQLCDVPTALVSLLDTDRQWFKARVGFGSSETDLNRSVCRHVVETASTLVIPDLTLDSRTSDNPLVTDAPHIRFYAGAPLITRHGVVGALCVIDTKPRPGGLAPEQQDSLERLARQVVALLEMRLDAINLQDAMDARDTLQEAQQLSERRWRDLYRNMDQGFIYARAIRDEDGQIRDWRYEEVNDAWGRVTGISPEQARGRTIRELIPGIEEEWVMELAGIVERREPVHFTRRVGALDRWYDGTAQWVGGDDFTVLFQEATTRIEDMRRRDALLELGDVLRDHRDLPEMIARASKIIGEAVGASRVSFGEMSHSRERVRVAAGWALPGMPPIEGDYRFDDYGEVRELLTEGQVLAVEDCLADPRTAAQAAAWEQLDARAIVNVPVRERGRTSAVLIAHKRLPHAWNADELAFLRNAADRLENANARRREEEQQDVVNGEIAHRLKNSLAMVQAIASQTLRAQTSREALDGFTHRLQALGTAHDALTAGRWRTAVLGDMVTGVLDAIGVRERCVISGPPVELGARAALSGSLLFHELTTNALKYGSLSVDGGAVTIAWRVEGDGDACELVVDWTEEGGPAASPPTRKGFGSRLIRLGLVGTGGSDIRYEPVGFQASFRAPLAQVEAA